MSSDGDAFASEIVERADRLETERRRRREQLTRAASEVGAWLRNRHGGHVQTFLIGSVTDPDRYRLESDLDIAVSGLGPDEYWEAWERAEELVKPVSVDLIRIETASESLRAHIATNGLEL